MKNFISIFEDIHDKFMDNFYQNEEVKKENKISNNENYYLDIIFNLKKITLTKFAEMAKVTKPAATQIINKFIDKGYVTKSISNSDKRVCYIELTENIKKYFNESYQKLNQFYQECMSFLSNEELKEFNTILLKINDNLS